MSDAKRCDRCGTFYEKDTILLREKAKPNDSNPPKIRAIRLRTQFDGIWEEFDLCENCLVDLLNWLGYRKKAEKKPEPEAHVKISCITCQNHYPGSPWCDDCKAGSNWKAIDE